MDSRKGFLLFWLEKFGKYSIKKKIPNVCSAALWRPFFNRPICITFLGQANGFSKLSQITIKTIMTKFSEPQSKFKKKTSQKGVCRHFLENFDKKCFFLGGQMWDFWVVSRSKV